jgi:hydrogenase maturation protein HypF
LRLHLRGVVQGVGFRPFVHRLAIRHGLAGRVRNESGSVFIEVEGPGDALDAFVAGLTTDAPPLASIDELRRTDFEPLGLEGFEIAPSASQPARRLPVSPDVAICDPCAAELTDPADRRHGYPFITCTDCGPRYTVIETMPYDRERTSMRVFEQCPTCLAEYATPSDRRYHSETNSCPACGPRIWLAEPKSGSTPPLQTLDTQQGVTGKTPEPRRVLDEAVERLLEGEILAVRGLGGFHLAADATNDAAVRRLRRRKAREAKPLAVMVGTLEEARRLGEVGPEEEALLTSRERPIVLLRRRPDAPIARAVAPCLDTVGLMLAYTPLHVLLLERVGRPLVMTSGNLSEEPIAISNDEAERRLQRIADAFLLHDREIVSRYDDSVLRVVAGQPVFLRRARGYAPLPIALPVAAPVPLVAVGPHLKNTFTLVHDHSAYVSQHVGDLENIETLEHFQDTLERYETLFAIRPEVAVRDKHPGYLSTRLAEELNLARILDIQHHHAHIAGVAAEHGISGPVIGLAFDGTGYGDDGNVWGAEVLVSDLVHYERLAHLRYAPLPGSDLAMRRPWRTALGYLSLEPDAGPAFELALDRVSERERSLAERQIERRLNAPLASSLGRLFDAAAAVLGVRRVARYEGQAAMELEALAGTRPAEPLPFPVVDAGLLPGGRPVPSTHNGDELAGASGASLGSSRAPRTHWVLDPLPLLISLGQRIAAGEDRADLAARFHESVAAAAVEVAARACELTGLEAVALGGGCFQNARLLASVTARLQQRGLRALTPRALSPNDGGISYGQAAVAAATLHREVEA